MISDNLTRDSELVYNLIEYEECDSIPIVFNCRHGIDPISKVVNDHDNVLIPPSRSWVSIDKVHPPLGEGINSNEWI